MVGAGPGDPELLTVKANKVISEADFVLYDRLVDDDVLALAKKAELIYVGKGSHHDISQDDINELLLKYAEDDRTVVRLKGGDPFIFGRGGEEMEYLMRNGVEVEVIPGISSIALPSLVGIPVTDRRYSSILTIVTGHEDPSKESGIGWEKLGELDGTIVILMGVGNLWSITTKLMGGGKDGNTPVALIEEGTKKDQRVIKGTLKEIYDLARREDVKPPAVIVIGEVVKAFN